jgi:hypothetical protein
MSATSCFFAGRGGLALFGAGLDFFLAGTAFGSTASRPFSVVSNESGFRLTGFVGPRDRCFGFGVFASC